MLFNMKEHDFWMHLCLNDSVLMLQLICIVCRSNITSVLLSSGQELDAELNNDFTDKIQSSTSSGLWQYFRPLRSCWARVQCSSICIADHTKGNCTFAIMTSYNTKTSVHYVLGVTHTALRAAADSTSSHIIHPVLQVPFYVVHFTYLHYSLLR